MHLCLLSPKKFETNCYQQITNVYLAKRFRNSGGKQQAFRLQKKLEISTVLIGCVLISKIKRHWISSVRICYSFFYVQVCFSLMCFIWNELEPLIRIQRLCVVVVFFSSYFVCIPFLVFRQKTSHQVAKWNGV